MRSHIENYAQRIVSAVSEGPWENVAYLAESLSDLRDRKAQVFICGNGGSAANAIHLANDFLYGVAKNSKTGLHVEALSANVSVLTCLANDIDYSEIYSYQLKTKGEAGDLLIVLSGSGNSPNVVQALKVGSQMNIKTFAILGFDGGACLDLADRAIHFPVHDMQLAEDLQLIVGHMCMQCLAMEA